MSKTALLASYGLASTLVVSAAPTTVSGVGSSPTVTSNNTTVSISGGVAPYTYAWTLFSSDTGSAGVTSPSSATTNFFDEPAIYTTSNAVFRCTVTDSLSATGSVDVAASFYYGI